MKVLLTGSSGFVGRYITAELGNRGHDVVPFDLAQGHDARDAAALTAALRGCNHFIACAALCGGVKYMSRYPHDILADNLKISATATEAAVRSYLNGTLQKITVISSSMVYEMAEREPFGEDDADSIPPPRTAYGFSKLAGEYLAKAALDQHGLPYTIVRLFNCTGPGDRDHVITDLVRKVQRGDDPLHIIGSGQQYRCFTWAEDLARGIVTAMEHPAAENETFNLASEHGTTILELAEMIWRRTRDDDPHIAHDEPYPHDVQRRVPSAKKARDMLGFEALVTLDEILDRVIAATISDALK